MSQDRRLRERAGQALRTVRGARLVLLGTVAAVVVVNTVVDGLAGLFLLRGDIDTYRAWRVFSDGLTAVINVILVFLVWILFEVLSRVERESDRLQAFMDNMYRRMP